VDNVSSNTQFSYREYAAETPMSSLKAVQESPVCLYTKLPLLATV
jgi:hypothetical protein